MTAHQQHPLPRIIQYRGHRHNSRTWFDTAALRAYRERRKASRFSDLSERDPG